MTTIKLNSGDYMPVLGLGTSKDVPEKIKDATLEALKTGYRLIDTAFLYRTEKCIGQGLKQAFESGIVRREDIFVITKLPGMGHDKEKVTKYLKLQLEELQLNYVDLYLIHMSAAWKSSKFDMAPLDMSFQTMIDSCEIANINHLETWAGMEECVDLGLTKSIGLSNFNSRQIQRILDNCRIKPSNLQVECHIYFQQNKLVEFCSERGITVSAYAPLGSPAYGKIMKIANLEPTEFKSFLEDETLLELAKKHSKTTAQIALRWLTQRGICALPKSVTPHRIKENFDIFDFELSDDDMAKIKSLDKNMRQFTYLQYSLLIDHPDYPFHDEF